MRGAVDGRGRADLPLLLPGHPGGPGAVGGKQGVGLAAHKKRPPRAVAIRIAGPPVVQR